MRFNEGGQGPSRERASRKASSTHTTCHKPKAAQFGIHHPQRIWVSLSYPVMCGWPLSISISIRVKVRVRERPPDMRTCRRGYD